MVRLNHPPTFTRIAARASNTANPVVPRRAPIQSASSSSRKGSARPSPSLSVSSSSMPRAVSTTLQLHTQSSQNVLAETTRITGACARALRGQSFKSKKDTNSVQSESHASSLIPKPSRMPKHAAKWVQSRQFVPTVPIVLMAKVNGIIQDIKKKKLVKSMEQEMVNSVEKALAASLEFEDSEFGEEDCSLVDNNPELLQDVSFDETVSKCEQSSVLSQLAKFEVRKDTMIAGGMIAVAPAYHGNPIIFRNRRHAHLTPPPAPAVVPVAPLIFMKEKSTITHRTKLPKPCANPPTVRKASRERVAIKSKPTVTSKPKPKPTVASRPKSKPTVASKLKSQPKSKSNCKLPSRPQTETLKTTRPRLPFSRQVQTIIKSKIAKSVTPITVKPKERQSQPDRDVNTTITPDAVAMPASILVSVPIRMSVRKAVRFVDGPPEPLLFNREAATSDLKSSLPEVDWTPLNTNKTYPSSLQATGFKTMFESTSLNTISLKRRVMHRFRAVQLYEQRRKEESVAVGELHSLGQLEYGNADYKISLQVDEVVTAYDIGEFVDPTVFGLPAGICGPLLRFGGFQDEHGRKFEDTVVPTTTTKPKKHPVKWPKAEVGAALEKWITKKFSVMQHAELAASESLWP